jgi:glycosyltransferase involved in cell wall biosynthesis
MPKVSVVIPTYNRAHVLPQTLQSVLAQTFQDFEVWLVDDGSVDNTREVVASVVGKRMHYVWQENRGESVARNHGIRSSTGELVAFLDSDDLWVPEMLARVVDFFDRHPDINVVFSDFVKFGDSTGGLQRWCPVFSTLLQRYREGEECIIPSAEMYECLVQELPIRPSAFAVRRRALAGRLFNEDRQIAEDWEFCLQLAKREAFGFIDAPLMQLRIWGEGQHYVDRRYTLSKCIELLKEEMALPSLTARQRSAVRKGFGQMYSMLGWYLRREGAWVQSAIAFTQGFVASGRPVMLGRAAVAFLPARVYRLLRTINR